MAIRLHFWGADQTVTGSSHHLECAGQNILLDCGLFQGKREDAANINSHLALTPEQLEGKAAPGLNAVVLSHAHIDHSGDLPLLAKQGYRGPIYTTPSTIDLCGPMLKDAAHIQESDAQFIGKRYGRRQQIKMPPGPAAMPPLYTQDDAATVNTLFKPVKLHEPQLLAGSTKDAGFTMTSTNAGHMLGSTNVMLEATEKGQTVRLLFSGDVGRKNLPIIKDPDAAPAADYLIMESTYGDRLHAPMGDVKAKLAGLVKAVLARGGHIIAPAFAVERTQQLVLLLHEMIEAKEIPEFPIFVDSPLASAVTEVFKQHQEDWDADACSFYAKGEDAFGWNRLKYTQDCASFEERDLGPAEPGADHGLSGAEYSGLEAGGEGAGGQHPGRADASAGAGGVDRLTERTCGPAGVAGLDGPGGANAEEGVPGAWGAVRDDGAEGEDRGAVQVGGGVSEARRPV